MQNAGKLTKKKKKKIILVWLEEVQPLSFQAP